MATDLLTVSLKPGEKWTLDYPYKVVLPVAVLAGQRDHYPVIRARWLDENGNELESAELRGQQVKVHDGAQVEVENLMESELVAVGVPNTHALNPPPRA